MHNCPELAWLGRLAVLQLASQLPRGIWRHIYASTAQYEFGEPALNRALLSIPHVEIPWGRPRLEVITMAARTLNIYGYRF